MIKMIIIDIDGTVYHHVYGIHKKTKEAILKAKELNIPVIIATGRNITTIYDIAKELEIDDSNNPFVSQNGGQSFTFKDKETKDLKIHYTSTFDISLTKELFEKANKSKIKIFAYSEQEKYAYCNKKISAFRTFMKFKTKRQKLINYSKWTNFEKLKVSKFICFGKTKNMASFRNFAEDNDVSIFAFSYVSEARANIELNPKGIDKSYGLQFVCEKMNIDPKDVIYFGDGENDIAALKWAGKGIAMANAKDEVKAVANDVTDLTVEHGGVGDYLFKNVFNKQ
ncbi:Cof-type HAD-IIB family hydrolase [Mesoplasma chauliocola]|uniref:Cof-type HAD-IIB family hydrolase n=1 Tax=Mesoplasma chauliocola TaxID=216427 RepID=A0A249SNS6_9MOLU|nr:Cof-type HAD-IIB family hydrolase [Mesoplasma chauliocola]ASZ09280.1 Cof-type HAD-IIB family hydrolase [Mesoplasma chauliocola]